MTPLSSTEHGKDDTEQAERGNVTPAPFDAATEPHREWTLTIPAPAHWISLNHRQHWAAKAKLTKAWRLAGSLAARNAGLPKGLERVHIIATITKPTRRKFDVSNLTSTVKSLIDGIVGDYGLLPDDDNAHLLGPDLRHNPTPGPASITIQIKEIK